MEPRYEEAIRKAEQRVVEALAKNMDLYGITTSTGFLYGTLLFQDKAMTLDEMGSALGMSKTSMSTGVRTLMDLNMVSKIWMKGTRKDHYEVSSDWYQNFIDFFSLKWRYAAEGNAHALKKSENELIALLAKPDFPEEQREATERSLTLIRNGLDYYDWLLRFIDVLESHEIFEHVPRKERNSQE